MAYVAGGAVAVVRKGLDHYGNTRGAVALVYDLLIVVGRTLARRLFDYSFDIIIGDVVRLGLGDDVLELGIDCRIGASGFDGDSYLTAYLCKDFGARSVGLFLLAFDRTPF